MLIARQSTAKIVTVGPVLDADGVAVTGGVVGDFKISKAGAAPAALNGSATLTHRHTGFYSLSLTTSDLDTVGSAEIVIDDTVNACPMKDIVVIEEAVYDALYAASALGYVANAPVNVAQWLGSAAATPTVAGVPEVDVTHWRGTAAPAEHTSGYPIVTIKDGTGTGEINTNAGAIALVDLVTTTTTVTNQHTTAAIATAIWQDATAGDFTTASSIGKALYIANIAPGGSGGHLISGSNAGTTTLGALTVTGTTTLAAVALTTLTASGAVAFQSTFAVTTSTALGAISGSTLTLSGAVAFQSTFAVTTSTALGAISGSTLTLSGAVAFQSTFAVTTSTSLAALSATTITASGTTSLAAVTTSGTVTLNALTVTNALTVSGTTTLTGAITATNASNNITLGTFTVTVNAIAWNAAWDTEVQSEANDALVANNLDHLVLSAVDTDFATTVHVDSVVGQMAQTADGGFSRATDSLEAIRDRGDAAWITATGFSTHSAADVWAVGTRSLTILDEDSTTLDLDTTIRAAVGLASANLDTQIGDLPTNAELATSQASADDATLSAIAALNNLSAAQVNAEVVDALATDTYAEPSGAPAATDDLATKIGFLYEALRNKITVTASAKTFYTDAGASQWSKSLSDDATTYTESEGS